MNTAQRTLSFARTRRLLPAAAAIVLAVSAGLVQADARTEVEGLWASGGSLLHVQPSGDSLTMKIVAIEEPLDEQGQPWTDNKNPDPTRHADPLLGLDILAGYRFRKGRWQGKIYDPETGKTYSSRMKVKDGRLEMRGYIGTPMLGKTKRFRHVSVCAEDIKLMLSQAAIGGWCGLE